MAYKLIPAKEKTEYNHYFGGDTWNMPICRNCNKPYQQLITLDLKDPRLAEFEDFGLSELPLISCLNCSSWWGYQCFRIDTENKEVFFIANTDEWHEKEDELEDYEAPFDYLPMELVHIENSDVFDENDIPDIFEDVGKEYIITVGEKPMLYDCDLKEIGNVCSECGSMIKYVAMLVSEQSCSKEPQDSCDTSGIYSHIGELDFGDEMLFFYYCPSCKTIHVYEMS